VNSATQKESSAQRAPVCCILGAAFGTRNMGVSALASGTLASIISSFPSARVFLLDYAKSASTYRAKNGGGTLDVELVNIRFSWRIYLRNNIARLILTALFLRLIPFRSLRESLMAKNPTLREIQNANIIVSLAGGDSFSDIYGMRRFFYVTLPQLLILAMGKPLIVLPQTLGPFKGGLAKAIAGFIMRNAEKVYARDRESIDEVRTLMRGQDSKIQFSYDMAFLLEPIAPATLPEWATSARTGPLVGLNVSGLLYAGGYTGKNMFGLKADYKALVHRIIECVMEKDGAQLVLVPHVFGNPGDSESDPAAAAKIYEELKGRYTGRLHLIDQEYDQHEIKYLIGRCDFFLGSRMHACIAALSQGIPAVGLAYSKKFAGVLRTIGAGDLVVDLRELDETEVISRIETIWRERDKTTARLSDEMPGVRKTVAGLFSTSWPQEKTNAPMDCGCAVPKVAKEC
jgi:polysaccharide pyruvyl transferase WcaK-like protein